MASVHYDHPNKKAVKIDLVQVLSYLAMAIVVILIMVPIFWMLSGSLKTNQQIMTFPPQWLPTDPQWHNYTDAWNAAPFGRFYINTIVTTLAGTTLELTNACLTAYALAFLRFPGKNLIFILLLAALMIPQQVTIIPNYLTVSDILGQNWINTYQGIVIPGASVAVGTFLLRQAFMSLPREVTFGLISLVAKWNDYLWPLIVTNQDRMRTLSVGISYLYNPESIVRWGPLLAGTFFVIAPLIVVYIWAQKHIIEGITAGATKS
jgi:sn-glycerol 3-phosphate transport system permease protein